MLQESLKDFWYYSKDRNDQLRCFGTGSTFKMLPIMRFRVVANRKRHGRWPCWPLTCGPVQQSGVMAWRRDGLWTFRGSVFRPVRARWLGLKWKLSCPVGSCSLPHLVGAEFSALQWTHPGAEGEWAHGHRETIRGMWGSTCTAFCGHKGCWVTRPWIQTGGGTDQF